MPYSKKDFIFSVASGLVAGAMTWKILDFLKAGLPSTPNYWLIIIVPVLWTVGVRLGFFLGKWFGFMPQLGKFAAIGLTNATVDFAVLNLLISMTGIALGKWYILFRGLSFLVAVTHSFFWNKYWTFEAGQSQGGGVEFGKFISVNLIAAALNIGIASFVANIIGPQFGLSDQLWANVSAVVGSACALALNFVGLRLLVFKK